MISLADIPEIRRLGELRELIGLEREAEVLLYVWSSELSHAPNILYLIHDGVYKWKEILLKRWNTSYNTDT
jgi:hypothetical protein